MSGINLLPWREELRRIRNRFFYAILASCVFAVIILVVISDFILQGMTSKENENIKIIQTELATISDKINKLQNLQKDKAELLNRMNIIQTLRVSRGVLVRFLDILPRVTPDGIYLTGLERKGDNVTISGNSQTNAYVSVFLENLQDPKWQGFFQDVRLEDITSSKESGLDFQIQLKLS